MAATVSALRVVAPVARVAARKATSARTALAHFPSSDYFAKGYNIYFGNPLPTTAGVDPGFSDHAGADIFDFQYTDERTTGLSMPSKLNSDEIDR